MTTDPGRSPFVIHGPLLTDGQAFPPSRVTILGGQIVAVQPGVSAAGADFVLTDGWLIPGLIDLQVNGAGGVDLTSAGDAAGAAAAVASVLVRHGVTAFCPTVISAPRQTTVDRLAALRPGMRTPGAECLGAHVEGPFLSPDYRGAHDLAALRQPDADEIKEWLETGQPAIVTLAPELPGAPDAIRQLVAAGVVVSLGHSGADVAAARRGLLAGARMATHLFNAMPPLHHRRPGLVGTLLTSSATLGLIADGVHVDPLVVDLVVRAAGVERVALVSDAVAAAGAPAGSTFLGSQVVTVDDRAVRRVDGTLAGSAALLDTGLRNAHAWLPWLPPALVVQMATQTPAAALGPDVAARKGRIAPGFDADLAVLDPDWHVVAAIVRGAVVWQKKAIRSQPARG